MSVTWEPEPHARSSWWDGPVYDDVEDDARRDFACNRSAFPPDDDDYLNLRDFCTQQGIPMEDR